MWVGADPRQVVATAHEVVALDIVLAAGDRHVEGLDGSRVVTGPCQQLTAHRGQAVAVHQGPVQLGEGCQASSRSVPLGQRDRGGEPHRR